MSMLFLLILVGFVALGVGVGYMIYVALRKREQQKRNHEGGKSRTGEPSG